MWQRAGSGKPQQNAAAIGRPSLATRIERQAAVDRSRLLAPCKQEVVRSTRAPPITHVQRKGEINPADWRQRDLAPRDR